MAKFLGRLNLEDDCRESPALFEEASVPKFNVVVESVEELEESISVCVRAVKGGRLHFLGFPKDHVYKHLQPGWKLKLEQRFDGKPNHLYPDRD